MICSHDDQLVQKAKTSVPSPTTSNTIAPQTMKTQQFGVPLQFIVDNNNGEFIPPIVKRCVEFLDNPDGN